MKFFNMSRISSIVSLLCSVVALVVSVYSLCVSNRALQICTDTQKEISVKLDQLTASVGELNIYCERLTNDIMRDNNINFYGVGVNRVK